MLAWLAICNAALLLMITAFLIWARHLQESTRSVTLTAADAARHARARRLLSLAVFLLPIGAVASAVSGLRAFEATAATPAPPVRMAVAAATALPADADPVPAEAMNPGSSQPEPTTQFVVRVPGSSGLLLRDSPAGVVVGRVGDGELVHGSGADPQHVDGRVWLEIQASSGEGGWAAADFLKPAS